MYGLVHFQHVQQVRTFLRGDGDSRSRIRCITALFDLEEVKKRICGMGIVATEGLKTELAVHEDNSIACFQEILGGGCTTSSYRDWYTC